MVDPLPASFDCVPAELPAGTQSKDASANGYIWKS